MDADENAVDEVHVGFRNPREAAAVLRYSLHPHQYKIVKIVYKEFGGDVLGYVIQRKQKGN